MFTHAQGCTCRPGRYVGRVGALAVALGVGGAILGFAGVAAADGETSGTGRSAGEGSARAEDSGRATATRSGDRRNTPAPAASSEADGPTARAVAPDLRAVSPRTVSEGRSARTRLALQPSAGDLPTVPIDLGNRALPALPGQPTGPASPGGGQVSTTASQPTATTTVGPETTTAPADSATAAAAPATALTADGNPASGADGGGEPLLAPLAWAALAAARRDDLAGVAPEVAPADAVATEDLQGCTPLSACVKTSPTKGAVGGPITITGDYLGGTLTVKFGCPVGTAECGSGVVASPSEPPTANQVKVTVPVGAPSGYIQLSGVYTNTGLPWTAKSSQYFTVDGAVPTIAGFTPNTGNIGTGGPTVTITGENFTDAVFVQFGSGKQTSLEISGDGKAITVAIPDGATTGPIVVGLPTGGTVSKQIFTVPLKTPLPPLSGCSPSGLGTNCAAVSSARVAGINALSTIFGQTFPSSGPVGTCAADSTGTNGCPIPFGQTTPSVANTVGIYAFNILYSLSGSTTPVADIGKAVTALATQPDVLNFISQTVAGSAALATLPPAVSTTIGDAVKTFVQTSFGNATVANGLVPFLRALNLPTTILDTIEFAKKLAKNPIDAVLSRFNSTQWPIAQAALQNSFFGDVNVQTQLGTAFTAATNVLLGSPAVSGYLGQLAASALVGTPVGPFNPLAVTLGGAIANFLATPVGVGTVGSAIAADAGTAFAILLKQPASPLFGGQPAVATSLADVVVNAVVAALGVTTPPFRLPQGLSAALAPGAGVAVTQFVNSVLNTPGIDAALGTLVTEVTTGVLSDQQLVSQVVSDAVTGFLGGGALAKAVGANVGAAAAVLAANPVVSGAVATLVNSVFGAVLNAPGAVTAVADAAGGLATAVLGGEDLTTALNAAIAAVAATPGIQAAIGPAVTTGVEQLLSDTDLRSAVDEAFASLVTGLVGDPAVQQAINSEVAAAVSGLLGGGDLGTEVGAKVGAAVVALLTNPTISGALVDLVDTVFGDFIGAPGVIPALSDAAGQLATAAVEGTLNTVQPQVLADLKANPDIDAAIQGSVVDAVKQFLGDTAVWSTVDAGLSALVTDLTTDPGIQQALSARVAAEVTTALGPNLGPVLGPVVGPQVGAAVVALISNPSVSGALVELVDTLFADFFGSAGVVDAVAGAAGDVALGVFTGETLSAALAAAGATLRANADVDTAVQNSVGAAVKQFLGDSALWSTVDTGLSSLVSELLADTVVQQALSNGVAAEVTAALGPNLGPVLGPVVGPQVGAAVVALITNPTVSTALVGLVDTVFSDFFGSPGVIDALSGAAGDVALAVFTGESFTAALAAAGKALRVNPDVDAGVQSSVGDAVTQFLGNTAVWSLVDDTVTGLVATVIADPLVQQVLTIGVTNAVSTALGGGDLGQVVGAQVAATVLQLINDPTVGTALLEVFDTAFSDLFGSPGVAEALGGAAGDLALAALTLTGADFTAAVQGILGGLRNNPALDTGVQNSVEAAVAQLLNDTAVWAVVDGAIANLLGEILGDTEVQQALVTRLTAEISTALGGGDLGAVVAPQVAATIVSLLTNPVVTAALPDVVDSLFTDFFGAAGVVNAISGAAGDIALAVLTGESPAAALQDALSGLENNPAIQAGVQSTVADALNVIDTDILSNTGFQQDLGQAITALIDEVAADQVVQAYITERFGPAIGGLFANTAVVGDIATAVGTAVTGLLGYPGVSTAVTDALAVFIDAVLGGTATGQAATEALQALQSDPAFVAGANSVLPPIVNGVLDTAEVRQAIGLAVQEATIARLEQSWFNIPFIDNIIAKVAKGTVEDFLTRPAGQKLIDDVVVDVVLGTPASDVSTIVTREILRRPELQIALGFSIGAGIGSLFGDNIIGDVIGFVAGFPATIVVGVGAVVIGIYEWIIGGLLSVANVLAGAAETTGPTPVLYLQAATA